MSDKEQLQSNGWRRVSDSTGISFCTHPFFRMAALGEKSRPSWQLPFFARVSHHMAGAPPVTAVAVGFNLGMEWLSRSEAPYAQKWGVATVVATATLHPFEAYIIYRGYWPNNGFRDFIRESFLHPSKVMRGMPINTWKFGPALCYGDVKAKTQAVYKKLGLSPGVASTAAAGTVAFALTTAGHVFHQAAMQQVRHSIGLDLSLSAKDAIAMALRTPTQGLLPRFMRALCIYEAMALSGGVEEAVGKAADAVKSFSARR